MVIHSNFNSQQEEDEEKEKQPERGGGKHQKKKKKKQMRSAEEKLKNMASAAKEHTEIFKAKLDEKVRAKMQPF